MKKFAIVLIGLFLTAFAFQGVNAQSNATAASSANVLEALKIVNNSNLDFGDISATATAGTVSIDNAGVRSGANGAEPVGDNQGSFAQFTITGVAGEAISIGLDQTTFNVTNTAGEGETMTVTLNENDVNTATGTSSTGDEGTVVLKFGGTVQVAANQAVGLYNNDAAFTVTVDYN